MRESTSTSPVCSAVKRCAAVSGVKRTFFASPSTAAAIARHTSTSSPRHSPCASGAENPATPVVTPHCTKFFLRTPSSVGVATDARATSAAGGTAPFSRAALEQADNTAAKQQIQQRSSVISATTSRLAFLFPVEFCSHVEAGLL